MHEHDALTEGAVEDRLVLVDLDLDADRLEPMRVLLTHVGSRATGTGTGAGDGAAARRLRSQDAAASL